MIWEPQGPQAARLPQRQDALIRRFRIPDSLLPGSLSLSQLRGGKPSWHCAQGDASGHPVWHLTFMVEGREHVQPIPQVWGAEVSQRVEALCIAAAIGSGAPANGSHPLAHPGDS